MSASAPRRDETTRAILSFLGLVAYIGHHQPTMAELRAHSGISRSTLRRRIALARLCGVVIECRREGSLHYYWISDYGPFDRAGLARLAQSPEQKPTAAHAAR